LKIKMSIEMDVTRQIIDEKINEGGSFLFKRLEDEIIQQGGADRVSSDVTVKQYLVFLTYIEILKYNPFTEEYAVMKSKRN